jgi:FSR family fosmidomycin resistance protein-like MFS transporter
MAYTSTLNQRSLVQGTSLVALLTIAHLTMDTLSSMPSALLPLLQAQFSLTEGMLALLVGILSFSSSVTQPLFGALSDRFGQRNIVALGLVVNAALLSLVGIASSVEMLIAVFFFGGLGSGALHPAGASLSRQGVKRKKGLAVSVFSTGGTLGFAIGPVLILYIIANYGLGFTPWLMIPGIVLGLIVYLFAPNDESNYRDNQRIRFNPRILFGSVGILSIASSLGGLAFVTFINAAPLWLVREHGIAPDSTIISWTLSAFTLSAALGGILAAALSTRIAPRFIISTTLGLAPIALYMIFAFEPHTVPFYVTVMFAGALVQASLPLMIVSAQNLAPQAMATASGMAMGFSSGVAGLLYIGTGYLQEVIGLVPAMQLSYLAALPAALLAFWILSAETPSN